MGGIERGAGPIALNLASMAIGLLLSACSVANYMGVPLQAGSADLDLQYLALRARADDKAAQFELGNRFEEGRGVERNLCTALRLYRLAAASSSGRTAIYVPPVRGAHGTVIPVDLGPRSAGISEAKIRIGSLTNSGSCH